MNPRLQDLSDKIDALSKGLGDAQKLLQDLASSENDDPKQELIQQISLLLPKLSADQLQSVADYVAFLSSGTGTHTAEGPGGGENQPPAQEGGP